MFDYFKMPYMEEPDDKGGIVTEKEPIVEPEEEKVPLATLLEEKKKRKELERQLREFKEKDVEKDVTITKTQLKQKYIEKGFDEDLADSVAEDIASIKADVKKVSFKELEDSSIDDDLKELAKDGFYADAPTYKKEIQAIQKEYKAKGLELDVEEAYMKLRGKTRMKEYKTEIEQKALLDRREVNEKKVPNAPPDAPKDLYPLDDIDKKALEGLQKAQPNGGWTIEKYYRLMKG